MREQMKLGDEIRYKARGVYGLYWGFIKEIDEPYAKITVTDIDGKMLWKPLKKRVLIKNLRKA
jgi:hypothetical protein